MMFGAGKIIRVWSFFHYKKRVLTPFYSFYFNFTLTPIIYGLSNLLSADIYIKHENHNPTGSFKVRGGINLMHHLKQAGIKGVITFSTGNHGLSVAATASWFGLEATIVVPENNNSAKNRNIQLTLDYQVFIFDKSEISCLSHTSRCTVFQ